MQKTMIPILKRQQTKVYHTASDAHIGGIYGCEYLVVFLNDDVAYAALLCFDHFRLE